MHSNMYHDRFEALHCLLKPPYIEDSISWVVCQNCVIIVKHMDFNNFDLPLQILYRIIMWATPVKLNFMNIIIFRGL
jgi:hypothetical protein